MMREYVQLAQTVKDAKRHPSNFMWSPKLDGERALWIPTLRGVSCPIFSRTSDILTGLFTRYGSIIQAPEWFLNLLPPFPCDGELLHVIDMEQLIVPKTLNVVNGIVMTPFTYDDQVQYTIDFKSSWSKTVSTVRKKKPVNAAWKQIQYMVFDIPSYDAMFQDGRINNNIVNNHTIVSSLLKQYIGDEPIGDKTFIGRYKFLSQWLVDQISQLPAGENQRVVPIAHREIHVGQLNDYLDLAINVGFEGLVGRDPNSVWCPRRTKNLIKYKPYLDTEGVIIGHTQGEGKYEGMLGAYNIEWITPQCLRQQFKLSGMDDEERKTPKPIGTQITFRYTKLTEGGIPSEARLMRERNEV